jgi:hypothetical protein
VAVDRVDDELALVGEQNALDPRIDDPCADVTAGHE